MRWMRYWLVLGIVLAFAATKAVAQDMPLVRSLLQQQLVAEMHQHTSEQTAWYNEKSVDRQSWTSGKVLGKKIRLASWTEQSKTWLWLEHPEESLDIEITKLRVVEGRAEFALRATARARFKAWGRIPRMIQASVGGTVLARFEIEGSTAMAGGGFSGTQVSFLQGRLDDLRFNNELARPFEDLIKDAMNDYTVDRNEKLRRTVERAVDRVRFAKPMGGVAAN